MHKDILLFLALAAHHAAAAFCSASLAVETRPSRKSSFSRVISPLSRPAGLDRHRRRGHEFLLATPEQSNEGARNDDFDDDEGEDDDIEIKPYGSRSLAWTKRYRRLNPYETCRQRVMTFGHRSKADWDDACASGQLGQYVPSRPDEMYAPEWVSWEEFLGIMRTYEETKNLAVRVLGLKSLDDYIMFVRGNPKRATGLRIPVRPDLYYKDDWLDEETFFSRNGDE